MKNIEEIKNTCKGADIWIIAAGASMNWIFPSFFDGKITIGINEVYKKYDCQYLIRKEAKGSEDVLKYIADVDTRLIMSCWDIGNHAKRNPIYDNVLYFNHYNNKLDIIDFPVDDDCIIVSWSTITSGMHIAAYMGAKNIILCGHDCGAIDGKVMFNGYLPRFDNTADKLVDEGYLDWVSKIESQSIMVRKWIKENYGCNIYSLNPFLNPGLEGHKWTQA